MLLAPLLLCEDLDGSLFITKGDRSVKISEKASLFGKSVGLLISMDSAIIKYHSPPAVAFSRCPPLNKYQRERKRERERERETHTHTDRQRVTERERERERERDRDRDRDRDRETEREK